MDGWNALRFIVTQTVPFSLLRSYILFNSFKNGSAASFTILRSNLSRDFDCNQVLSAATEGPLLQLAEGLQTRRLLFGSWASCK